MAYTHSNAVLRLFLTPWILFIAGMQMLPGVSSRRQTRDPRRMLRRQWTSSGSVHRVDHQRTRRLSMLQVWLVTVVDLWWLSSRESTWRRWLLLDAIAIYLRRWSSTGHRWSTSCDCLVVDVNDLPDAMSVQSLEGFGGKNRRAQV